MEYRTDEEAVVAYKNGEKKALEELVIKYKSMLLGYIKAMVYNKADAEEIFQEVWVRLIKDPQKFKGGNLAAWLTRVAHNMMVDYMRKKKPDVALDGNEDEEDMPLIDRIADENADPLKDLMEKDSGERLKQIIMQLPQEQREVFLMRAEMGMSFKEIADAQKVSINTVLARMQYAVGKLRRMVNVALQ